MADIFVSYSHNDRIKVTRLVRALEAQGWTIWWDRESIPGTFWDQTITRELKSARCVIVAWSEESAKSSFVKEEAGLALAHDKLLPVSLDQTAPPNQFSSIEVLDLSRWLGSVEDPNFVLLKQGVERFLGNEYNDPRHSVDKLKKNRSALRVWGITIGGTFFGFSSGIIAKPLTTVAAALLICVFGLGAYVRIQQAPTDSGPTVSRVGGLSRVEPDHGTPVIFATTAGKVTIEGEGTNSPFLTALVRRLPTPGLEIRDLFRLIWDDVATATGGKQVPDVYGHGSDTDLYFLPGANVSSHQTGAETRVALVIGSSNYKSLAPLRHPRSDAAALAATLREVGFRTVTLKTDLSRIDLNHALSDFDKAAREAELALIYFAGHGIAVRDVNYLIPVDAKIDSEADLQFEAIPLEQVVRSTEGARRMGLVIIDAAHGQPVIHNTATTR